MICSVKCLVYYSLVKHTYQQIIKSIKNNSICSRTQSNN